MEEPYLDEEESQEEEQEPIRTVQLCIFELGKLRFAVDILQVQEIIAPAETTWVPTTPGYLKGVINLRGTIVPIIEVEDLLGIEPLKHTKTDQILIIRDGNLLVGMRVSRVVNIVNIPEDNITIFDEENKERQEKYLLGTGMIFENQISLLDIHRLLAEAKNTLSTN